MYRDQDGFVACTREKHDIEVVRDVYREVCLRLCDSSTGRDMAILEDPRLFHIAATRIQ